MVLERISESLNIASFNVEKVLESFERVQGGSSFGTASPKYALQISKEPL